MKCNTNLSPNLYQITKKITNYEYTFLKSDYILYAIMNYIITEIVTNYPVKVK